MRNRRIEAALAEHQGRLRAFVRRQLRGLPDAEDIIQEVLYELIVAYDLAKPIGHLAAWMIRVARNRIIDRVRVRAREGEPERVIEALEVPDAAGPETEYAQAMLADELERAIAELPRAEREVFLAHELEGRTFRELAASTGTNLNTLLGRKHAAVRHLRRRLRAAYEEFARLESDT
jgi:RNA polymerase sigma factor (sigma-70 family)